MYTDGMKIMVYDAHIKSATVEIKALTISGKQVTLAVFRQLQEKEFYDGNYNILGDLWGQVNYCPGKACQQSDHDSNHVHVVFSYEDQLFRYAISKPFKYNFNHGVYDIEKQIMEINRHYYANAREDDLEKLKILHRNLEIEKEKSDYYLNKYTELWDRVSNLPQLFIAV